jgi:hypothetical protein
MLKDRRASPASDPSSAAQVMCTHDALKLAIAVLEAYKKCEEAGAAKVIS